MTALVEQLESHHTTQKFLNDMTAKLFHAKLMEIVAHTKIESLSITLSTCNEEDRTIFSLSPVKFELGTAMTDEALKTFHQRLDGSYDLGEHGNEGMATFLENEIEWSLWQEIMNDLSSQMGYLVDIFGFHYGPVNHLVFTKDAWWTTYNPKDYV